LIARLLLILSLSALPVVACHATPGAVDFVRVDKSERTLYLLSGKNVVAHFPVVLGGAPVGPKQREGDKRTPEGRYVLDLKKQDSAFFRAIHISYPNAGDLSRAKQQGVDPGSAIMIHGQTNGLGWLSFLSQRLDWTNGCIALSNEDMQQVWNLVQVPTPIEITP
jgi:murein L,D-transpeptidase YafK